MSINQYILIHFYKKEYTIRDRSRGNLNSLTSGCSPNRLYLSEVRNNCLISLIEFFELKN